MKIKYMVAGILMLLLAFFLFNPDDGNQVVNKNDLVGTTYIKGVPEELDSLFSIAVMYYPELVSADIELEFKRISTTMQARPKISSFFSQNRKYLIVINSNDKFEGIRFSDVPDSAIIGAVCHELAHILDYQGKSNSELIRIGLNMLNARKRANFERSVDSLTIRKGCGSYLRNWSQFALYEAEASEEYKEFKRKTYMNSEEISSYITFLNGSKN